MGNKVATQDGWTRVRFGDVVRLSTERCTDPAAAGIDRYVGLEHLEPGDLRIRSWGNVADGVTFTNRFRPGQVLFGKRRAYQRKVAIADFDGICSSDIYVFEPSDEQLLPSFLPFICHTDGFFEHALKTSAGSLSPRTNWKSLAGYTFELPTIEGQHSFVQLGKPVRTLLESLRLAEAQTAAALNAARESLINASSGPSVLLRDVVAPERPICYGILMPGAHISSGVPVIKVKDYPDGLIEVDGLLHTSPDIDAEYSRSKLNEGDIILSIRGTIGRLAKVPSKLQGANITQDTARLSVAREHSADYVMECLQSRLLRSQMREQTTGLAVQGLNIGAIRLFSLPMPPRKQQDEIAERLASMRAALQEIRQRQQKVSAIYQRFLETLCRRSEV